MNWTFQQQQQQQQTANMWNVPVRLPNVIHDDYWEKGGDYEAMEIEFHFTNWAYN